MSSDHIDDEHEIDSEMEPIVESDPEPEAEPETESVPDPLEGATEIQVESTRLFRAHPWHGISIGDQAPDTINAYIEILPTDTVKYELDKVTGLLRIDRPQRFSNVCPELYGFVPQTYCGEQVAEYCRQKTGRDDIIGDGDPLDICVLTEKHIAHVNIYMRAHPIGGLRMLDGDEADDKIIAILEGDPSYGYWQDISQCPSMLVERLRHYFLTYKQAPDAMRKACEITHVYGAEEAKEVIRRSNADYLDKYHSLASHLDSLTKAKIHTT